MHTPTALHCCLLTARTPVQCMPHSRLSWHSTTSRRWARPRTPLYNASVRVACVVYLTPRSIYCAHLRTCVYTSCPPQSTFVTLVPTPLAPSVPLPFAPAVISDAVAVVVRRLPFIIITSSLCLASPSLVCTSGGIPRCTRTLHLHPPPNFKSVATPTPAPTPNALDACVNLNTTHGYVHAH